MTQESLDDEKLENWIAYKRDIVSLYRNGGINRNEYTLYLHLRLTCNAYGICTTNLETIKSDLFPKLKGVNYIEKLVLSLKRKRLIWFKDRRGCRGSFEIHFGDFILPDKKIKKLDKYFEDNLVRGEEKTQEPLESEVSTKPMSVSQNLNEGKKALIESFSMDGGTNQVRSCNNNKDKEKDNENIDD